jgi:hypothetical protein
MSELPKFVRQRMQQETPGGQHPDTDLLTALVERSLTSAERAQVLEHLATCASCRDVVTLAAPEMVEPAGEAVPEHAPWARWMGLRWAAVGVTAAILVAAVVLRMPQREQPSLPAATRDAGQVTNVSPEQKPAAEPVPPANREAKLAAKPKPQRARPGVVTDGLAKKEMKQEDFAAAEAQAPSAPAPPQSNMAQAPLMGRRVAVPAESRAEAGQAAAPEVRSAAGELERSADAAQVVSKTGAQRLRQSAPPPGKFATTTKASPVRWSISPDGRPMRSHDRGATWELVPVGEGVVFRAVTAIANHVWAGGSGGALFHSSDGGAHWTAVDVTEADIMRIEFTDPLHGRLLTATGELWSTSDGGQSWEKK